MDFFTPARRKTAYKILVVVVGLLVAHGIVTAGDATSYLQIAAELLVGGGVLLAHANVPDTDGQ